MGEGMPKILRKMITAGVLLVGTETVAQNFDHWVTVTPEEFKRRNVSVEQMDSVDMSDGDAPPIDNSKMGRKFTDKNGNTFYWINTRPVIENKDDNIKTIEKEPDSIDNNPPPDPDTIDLDNAIPDTMEIEIGDLNHEIEASRVQRIRELKDFIESKKGEIQTNENKDLFEKKFRSDLDMEKRGWEGGIQRLRELPKDVIEKLSPEEADVYLKYILVREHDHHVSEEEKERLIQEGKGENFFGSYSSFEGDSLGNRIFDDFESPLFKLYHEDDEFLSWNNYGEMRLVDFIDPSSENKDSKKNLKMALDSMLAAFISKSMKETSFEDEEAIQKALEEAWQKRPTLKLELELFTLEKELENIEKNLNIDTVVSFIDSSRTWLLNNIASKEYLKKLVEGEGLSMKDAVRLQTERFSRVFNMPYEINPDWKDVSRYRHNEDHEYIEFDAYDVARYPVTNALHEFEHSATDAHLLISEKAKELYASAYVGDKEFWRIVNMPVAELAQLVPDPESFNNPSEMDARKKVLEYDMEKLGVKKPGEIMTREHYVKLMELFKQKRLDHNSMQIILLTTEEGLIRILNEVASIEGRDEFNDKT